MPEWRWNGTAKDGNALLFNLHISARGEKPDLFPTSEIGLADDHAWLLFRMSSPLAPSMLREAQVLETSVGRSRQAVVGAKDGG